MKKNPNNRAYINILYVRTTKSRRKPIFLVLYVKKVKIISRVNPYFSMNFVFLPSPQENSVFHETPWFMHRL
jgi:hypothetical protein